jgi:hypothetical protein
MLWCCYSHPKISRILLFFVALQTGRVVSCPGSHAWTWELVPWHGTWTFNLRTIQLHQQDHFSNDDSIFFMHKTSDTSNARPPPFLEGGRWSALLHRMKTCCYCCQRKITHFGVTNFSLSCSCRCLLQLGFLWFIEYGLQLLDPVAKIWEELFYKYAIIKRLFRLGRNK